MNENHTSLIDSLVDDLRPVRPLRRRAGGALLAAALCITVVIVILWLGLRAGLLAGVVSPLFLITNGLLLLLGLAAATAVIAMANPQVGVQHDGPKWALAMVALLPLTALVTGLAGGATGGDWFSYNPDVSCIIHGLGCGTLIAIALGFWLRRGAPVSLDRAGFYLGIAAGALGSFAYGMACPAETMNHLGIWHVAPVAIGALIGRLALPRLLRW